MKNDDNINKNDGSREGKSHSKMNVKTFQRNLRTQTFKMNG